MTKKVLSILLFFSILAGMPGIVEASSIKKDFRRETKQETRSKRNSEDRSDKIQIKTEQETVTPGDGTRQRTEKEIKTETFTLPVYFSPANEKYVYKNGYFYVYVRKKGEPIEKGYWYRCSIKVGNLSAGTSQDIAWDMEFLGTMPKSYKNNVKHWLESVEKNTMIDTWLFSFDIEKGKNWEKTRQDAFGTNPVLSDQKEFTEEEKLAGFPYSQRYYMMCGKFLYNGNGYRLYFDPSAFGDMKGMDIEPENKDIQKKDEKLREDEKSWTGDEYFKFAIDTNNVGMTNYGASGEFHNCMYGFYLKPNPYTIKFHANGGTGKMGTQSAVVDKKLELNQNKYTRVGHSFKYWQDSEKGTDTIWKFQDKEEVMNLTRKYNKIVNLYAHWEPNTLKIKYNANGGTIAGTPGYNINEFAHAWLYTKGAADLGDFKSFGLTRTGYHRKEGEEWNTKADGTGRGFDQGMSYEMTQYAPELASRDCALTMYAQWEPNTYTITLNHGISNPEIAGTKKIYEKYDTGWYLDAGCTKVLQEKETQNKITIPQKQGYVFQGYYDTRTGGKRMIDRHGKLTAAGAANYRQAANATWYAQYQYKIKCEDYADIPCDLEEMQEDNREHLGIQLFYDSTSRKVNVITADIGSSICFTGKPAGTKIGNFQSSVMGNSAIGETREGKKLELSLAVQEGAAYHLSVTASGNKIFDQLVYYKHGRFRTLAKLGENETKTVDHGSSIRGENWGTQEPSYTLYQYQGCSELTDIDAPEKVYRYYIYKGVNMAYSGNGATSGRNMLEYDVSLEDRYQFRTNEFKKEKRRSKRTADGKVYWCDVKYKFEGWELGNNIKNAKDIETEFKIYQDAKNGKAVSYKTLEDFNTYQIVEPIFVKERCFTLNDLIGQRAANKTVALLQTEGGTSAIHASEYINLQAKWNEFPTIVVTPGDKLEFYEGEEVTKDDLIKHLTAHDEEDSENHNEDLNQMVKIIKVSYPESINRSQKAYEKFYKDDVPEDFLLDTYYLKLEKNEIVKVLVTFAVTDSKGNTTEQEIPVKVKYNNYPEICSEDVFYYFKSEANQGEITEEALLNRAIAQDKEDGEITQALVLKDFDPQVVKMQSESKAEFDITYQVTDAFNKTTYKVVTLIIWDNDALTAEMPNYYVRFISEKYLDTLERNSVWREPENFVYLKNVLSNETPMETWEFTHEDVIAIQEWITNGKNGEWKIGKEANEEFLNKFAKCRK